MTSTCIGRPAYHIDFLGQILLNIILFQVFEIVSEFRTNM